MDLSKVGNRERLKARREPYWQRLREGVFLGYRPSRKDGPGTWIARAREPVALKYKMRSLGEYSTLTGSERFAAAKQEAESFAVEIEGGSFQPDLVTVADACRAYNAKGNDKATLRRLVYSDPIAGVKLDKLRRHHLEAWRKRLTGTPATINRAMVPLRAALRRVKVEGAPGTDAAWQEALRPAKGANGRRTLYLDRDERHRLLNAAQEDIEPFLRAMCMLPLRPGTLANICVKDFDRRLRTLTIGKDKSGNPRQIHLSEGIAAFMAKHCKDKLPNAWIFARADGAQWDRNRWKGPIVDARTAAGLPSGTTAYTLRHCVLTDLVMAGVPVLTVAQLADTSVAMIEAHYGHLTAGAAAEALDRIAL